MSRHGFTMDQEIGLKLDNTVLNITGDESSFSRAEMDWRLRGMLYEMICGKNPFYFVHTDKVDLCDTICNENYCPFPTKPSKAFVALVDGLLEKDPAQGLGMLAGGSKEYLLCPVFTDHRSDFG
jgi:serine/threonine protein kinase